MPRRAKGLLKRRSATEPSRATSAPLPPPSPLPIPFLSTPSLGNLSHSKNPPPWLSTQQTPRISALLTTTAAVLLHPQSRAWTLTTAPKAHAWLGSQRAHLLGSCSSCPCRANSKALNTGPQATLTGPPPLLPPSPQTHSCLFLEHAIPGVLSL